MLSNMATSLIMHKRITTTLAKAKALRVYIEPIITRSKDDTTHSRRMVFSYLQSKEAVTELFRDISSKVADRPGGYTRIIKLGQRLGDNADMAMIELVDFNLNLLGEKSAAKAKGTRRGRRGPGKKGAEEVTATAAAGVKAPKATSKKEEIPAAPAIPAPEPKDEEIKEAIAEPAPIAEAITETDAVAEAEEPQSEEKTPSEEETKA
jgi:large subunit ribosomal protein L17